MKGDNNQESKVTNHLEEKLKHIGGVNAELGGVDPDIDKNLMRLSGGP